jgi:single-stranded-DNA-specific exonuclease
LEKFYQKVLEFAEVNINEETFQRQLNLEAELEQSQLSIENCQLLQLLEPFGVDNFKPKFLISGLPVASLRFVGQEGKHLQIKFQTENGQLEAIMFSASESAKKIGIGSVVDAAAELMLDTWNGQSKLKLRIVDVRQVASSK